MMMAIRAILWWQRPVRCAQAHARARTHTHTHTHVRVHAKHITSPTRVQTTLIAAQAAVSP